MNTPSTPHMPLRGIFNILATPFDAAQQVDYASLRRLVNFQLALGAHGLTILGVLGEAAKLSLDERRAVMDTVMETVAGRAPVVVGASHADRESRRSLCRAAFAAGAAAVMIAPPRMDQPTDAAVIALYADIAAATDRPIVVQDFPPVNNVIMSPDMLAQLAEQVPHCRTLKLEDPPLMEKIAAIRARTDAFAIFGGLGGMFLLEELARGAAGTMTGFAFTEILVAVYDAFTQGRLPDAEAIFDRYLPLIRYENQPVVNLTIRKALLCRRGAIAHSTPRHPFTPLDAGTQDELTWVLRRVGIDDPKLRLAF
ncbi:MAG: dihydrodipicolinate synthase family protein [Anaerolineae bacterium]|nr:dihydrodipicolinate synthase family protein [Anaerolineae bacterium]